MEPETSDFLTAFNSSLLDASGQQNLIMGSSESNELIWKYQNQKPRPRGDTLVSGGVNQNQYHFVFILRRALTKRPR